MGLSLCDVRWRSRNKKTKNPSRKGLAWELLNDCLGEPMDEKKETKEIGETAGRAHKRPSALYERISGVDGCEVNRSGQG